MRSVALGVTAKVSLLLGQCRGDFSGLFSVFFALWQIQNKEMKMCKTIPTFILLLTGE